MLESASFSRLSAQDVSFALASDLHGQWFAQPGWYIYRVPPIVQVAPKNVPLKNNSDRGATCTGNPNTAFRVWCLRVWGLGFRFRIWCLNSDIFWQVLTKATPRGCTSKPRGHPGPKEEWPGLKIHCADQSFEV